MMVHAVYSVTGLQCFSFEEQTVILFKAFFKSIFFIARSPLYTDFPGVENLTAQFFFLRVQMS